MNASSGIYNINGYNILCNNTTILSTLNVKGVDVSNYINNNNTNLSNINTNLNNLSTNTTLNISNLNNTSTTIFTNLNNLSTNSTLNISNLNATSTTLLGYINALTNPTTLKVNNLNLSQTSVLNGASTCISTLNVSGVSRLNNTNIKGIVNIYSGTQFATSNNYMKSGSLTIGDINENYGNGTNWNTNTSGLLLECLDNTEIAVHDSGQRISSLLCYEGGTLNNIVIGRDMGWGSSSLKIKGITKIGSGNVADEFTVFDVHGNIILKKNYIFGGTNYGDDVYIAAANSATTTQSYINVKSTGIDIAVLNTNGILFIDAFTRIVRDLNVQGSIYY